MCQYPVHVNIMEEMCFKDDAPGYGHAYDVSEPGPAGVVSVTEKKTEPEKMGLLDWKCYEDIGGTPVYLWEAVKTGDGILSIRQVTDADRLARHEDIHVGDEVIVASAFGWVKAVVTVIGDCDGQAEAGNIYFLKYSPETGWACNSSANPRALEKLKLEE